MHALVWKEKHKWKTTVCIPRCRWEKKMKGRQQLGYRVVSCRVALWSILRPYAPGCLDLCDLGFSLGMGF